VKALTRHTYLLLAIAIHAAPKSEARRDGPRLQTVRRKRGREARRPSSRGRRGNPLAFRTQARMDRPVSPGAAWAQGPSLTTGRSARGSREKSADCRACTDVETFGQDGAPEIPRSRKTTSDGKAPSFRLSVVLEDLRDGWIACTVCRPRFDQEPRRRFTASSIGGLRPPARPGPAPLGASAGLPLTRRPSRGGRATTGNIRGRATASSSSRGSSDGHPPIPDSGARRQGNAAGPSNLRDAALQTGFKPVPVSNR